MGPLNAVGPSTRMRSESPASSAISRKAAPPVPTRSLQRARRKVSDARTARAISMGAGGNPSARARLVPGGVGRGRQMPRAARWSRREEAGHSGKWRGLTHGRAELHRCQDALARRRRASRQRAPVCRAKERPPYAPCSMVPSELGRRPRKIDTKTRIRMPPSPCRRIRAQPTTPPLLAATILAATALPLVATTAPRPTAPPLPPPPPPACFPKPRPRSPTAPPLFTPT